LASAIGKFIGNFVTDPICAFLTQWRALIAVKVSGYIDFIYINHKLDLL
jgi:hypothetical protein